MVLVQTGHNGAVHPVGYLTSSTENSAMAEAFRCLRSRLLLPKAGSPPRTIVVTSAIPGEGKTITSIGISVMLAQRGKRVLLVDADLRQSPNIQHPLLDHPSPGLSECLANSETEQEAVRVSGMRNLDVVPAGDWPPNPAELLDSDAMRSLLSKWAKSYDHIVIDTPPILGYADALAPAAIADGVLVVARAEHTDRQSLRDACEILEQVRARTLGIVLNAVHNGSAPYARYNDQRLRLERGNEC
jgi:capsular exopolysaccharide synthesis family protein